VGIAEGSRRLSENYYFGDFFAPQTVLFFFINNFPSEKKFEGKGKNGRQKFSQKREIKNKNQTKQKSLL